MMRALSPSSTIWGSLGSWYRVKTSSWRSPRSRRRFGYGHQWSLTAEDKLVRVAVKPSGSHGKMATQVCGTQAVISMKSNFAGHELRIADYRLIP